MGALKEVARPGLVKPETRDQIANRNREAAKSLWAGKLTQTELAAVNAICEGYGLDPLLKHILVLGGNLYITVAGVRTWAYKQDDKPVAIQVVPASREERDTAGCPEGVHYWKAKIWKKDTPADTPFTEFGEADKDNVSLHRAGWKEIQDMAKTRAIGRALRNAYPISLPLAEDMPLFPWEGALDVTPQPTSGEQSIQPPAPTPQPASEPQSPALPPAGQPLDTRPISEPQQKRFYAIMRGAKVEDPLLHDYLAETWGIEHVKDIQRHQYEQVCLWVESQGKTRAPGEEG